MLSLATLTIHKALEGIRTGTLDPLDLWDACTGRIERINPRLNAIITRTERVETGFSPVSVDQAAGPGQLIGIPIAIKDMFETAGVRTTAGSLFYKDFIPEHDAETVRRLRAAGAQVIGKTNTHEIALGVTTVNPHFGATRNPWADDRVPGGSSGGSAVAVATGMALGALGTDTGGSIRIPAALCGVVGLKPTFGRVSLRGIFPLSWNLDHAGPITRCVRDAALLLAVIAGYDSADPSSLRMPVDNYDHALEAGAAGLKILAASGDYIEDSDPDILAATRQAADLLLQLGAQVVSMEIPKLRDAAVANGLMTQADAAAFHRDRLAENPELFGQDVRQRLETGRRATAAEYALARRVQVETSWRLTQLLQEFDVILLPTTPCTAPTIEHADAVEQARRLTRFTSPFNLSGLPAISIPGGFDRQDLPIGVQLVAAAWNESTLLRAARAIEREIDWGARLPRISEMEDPPCGA